MRVRHLHRTAAVTAKLVVLDGLVAGSGGAAAISRIIVLKLDHIGDLIVAMPAMRILRESFPHAHITLVCASWNCGWARQFVWFDEVVAFDFFSPLNRHWDVAEDGLLARYDAFAAAVSGQYDLAVDLRHDADTRPCLYRLHATWRAGFAAPAAAGLPHLDLALPNTEGLAAGEGHVHSLHAELRLTVLANAVSERFAPPRPHPAVALAQSSALPADLAPSRRAAVLAIGAGDPIRYWPIDRYVEVGHALIAQHDMDIIILCGEVERDDASRLAGCLPAARVQTLICAPLDRLTPLLARSALCISNGSGMSHLAAALDVPTVAILGGTTRMSVWHPRGARALALGGMTPCQPCGLKRAEDCPWGVVCLTAVTPADVLAACTRLLNE